MKRFLTFLRGNEGDGHIVPPAGLTAHLTLFASAAMAFLAVFALVLTLAASRQASQWSNALAGSATVRIAATAADMEQQLAAVMTILSTTDGVEQVRVLDEDEQAALLTPWLGAGLPMDQLPIPQLVEVDLAPGGLDSLGLTLRLQAEAPDAVFDDHTRWRAPLATAGMRLRWLGWGAVALIAVTMAAMVALSVRAALAANRQDVGVLHLIGARDSYIARAFVWRFSGRAVGGALIGTVCGIGAVVSLPEDPGAGSFLTGLHPQGAEWLLLWLVPPFAAFVAYLATRFTVLRMLRRDS